MSASSAFSKVEKMLEKCAPGSTIRLANHSRVIHFGGKVYRTFPKADPVENGHIRKLARFFGISDCAALHFPGVVKATDAVEVVESMAAETEKPAPAKGKKNR